MLSYFFHWYDGGLWSNLLANLVWAIPIYIYGRYHFKRLHKKQHDIHKDIKQLIGENE